MKRIVIIVLSLVLMITTFTIPVQAEELTTPSGIAYSDIQTEIEQYIKERETGLASVEVAVFDEDETLYSGYFGCADVENGLPADEETVYEWGSCSKLLVWVSIMQLYEQGRIDLEADIRIYLPEGFLAKLQYNEPITMLNLMSHTAGWQETVYTVEVDNEKDIVSLETALKSTEPQQAYAPNEHTAYSNWGTALAAYIVEQVSGMDYTEYVHENILEPLGMEHTSVSADFSDNAWVRAKRNELKSYMIMEGINDSYGNAISYILLYPAGSVTGTLEDFTTFAKAFTSDICPFFEKQETRDLFLTVTSYYGESDISKNCHGLWTYEHAVQTVGHGGNTNACSSMLQFDPVSGLGVVIMTNECGESAFNNGIPALLFGNCNRGNITDTSDISGVYIASRGYDSGFLKLFSYIGSGLFMPVMKTDSENTFSIVGIDMYRIADNQWIQDDGNGTQLFMYETYKDGRRVFEMMSTDYIMDSFYWCKAGMMIGFILFSSIAIISLLVKAVVYFIRRTQYHHLDKSVLYMQILQALSGIGVFIILVFSGVLTKGFAVIFCVFAGGMALLSLANSIYLLCGTLKASTLKRRTIVKNFFWVFCGVLTFVVIAYFQLYDFVSC